jgi:hypothetical protein
LHVVKRSEGHDSYRKLLLLWELLNSDVKVILLPFWKQIHQYRQLPTKADKLLWA